MGRTSLIIALLIAVAGLSLAGCNTVRGVGQDIEKGGEWIQRSTR
jgi:predicted small secreted protein